MTRSAPTPFEELWRRRDEFDLLLGCRTGRRSNWSRRVVTLCGRLVIRALFNSKVADANTPYRLMRRSAFADLLRLLPDNAVVPNVMLSGLAGSARLRLVSDRGRGHRSTGRYRSTRQLQAGARGAAFVRPGDRRAVECEAAACHWLSSATSAWHTRRSNRGSPLDRDADDVEGTTGSGLRLCLRPARVHCRGLPR